MPGSYLPCATWQEHLTPLSRGRRVLRLDQSTIYRVICHKATMLESGSHFFLAHSCSRGLVASTIKPTHTLSHRPLARGRARSASIVMCANLARFSLRVSTLVAPAVPPLLSPTHPLTAEVTASAIYTATRPLSLTGLHHSLTHRAASTLRSTCSSPSYDQFRVHQPKSMRMQLIFCLRLS